MFNWRKNIHLGLPCTSINLAAVYAPLPAILILVPIYSRFYVTVAASAAANTYYCPFSPHFYLIARLISRAIARPLLADYHRSPAGVNARHWK